MRLIDADAMLVRLEEWNTSDLTDKALYNFTLHRILEQPTIEPSAQPERKTGKWILQIRYDNKGEPLLAWYQCSECGAFIANNEANFCSDCGADMRETWEVKK